MRVRAITSAAIAAGAVLATGLAAPATAVPGPDPAAALMAAARAGIAAHSRTGITVRQSATGEGAPATQTIQIGPGATSLATAGVILRRHGSNVVALTEARRLLQASHAGRPDALDRRVLRHFAVTGRTWIAVVEPSGLAAMIWTLTLRSSDPARLTKVALPVSTAVEVVDADSYRVVVPGDKFAAALFGGTVAPDPDAGPNLDLVLDVDLDAAGAVSALALSATDGPADQRVRIAVVANTAPATVLPPTAQRADRRTSALVSSALEARHLAAETVSGAIRTAGQPAAAKRLAHFSSRSSGAGARATGRWLAPLGVFRVKALGGGSSWVKDLRVVAGKVVGGRWVLTFGARVPRNAGFPMQRDSVASGAGALPSLLPDSPVLDLVR